MGPIKINETWLISSYQDVKTAFEAPEKFTNDKTTPFFAYNTEKESYSYKEKFASDVLKKWINHTNNDVSHIKNELTSRLYTFVLNDMEACIVHTLQDIFERKNGAQLDYKKEVALPVMSRIAAGVLGLSHGAEVEQFDALLYKHADAVSFLREEIYLDKEMAEKFADSLLYFLKLGPDFKGDYDVFHEEEYNVNHFDIFQIQQSIVFSAMVFNTIILLCNTIKLLIENQEKFTEAELNTAILEAIRLESPIQSTLRVTKNEVEISGVKIPKGENLILLIGSANRDGENGRIPEPTQFRMDRDRKPIMTFGHGVHACIGRHMSLKIAEIVNRELLYKNDASLIDFEWDNTLKGHRDLQKINVKLESKTLVQ